MSEKNLSVRFSVKDQEVVKRALAGLGDEGERALKRLERASAGPSKGLRDIDAAASTLRRTLVPAALIAYTKSSIDAVDAMSDLSKRTGVAVESITAFNYVAKMSGTDIATFANGLKFLNKNLGEAQTGNKTAAEAFSQLGLSIKELSALTPEQQFVKIADKIDNLSGSASKTKATLDIFGKSGSDLIPIMEGGADAIEKMLSRAHDLGLVFSAEQAGQIAEFNDQIDSMTMALQSATAKGFLVLTDSVHGFLTMVTNAEIAVANMTGILSDEETENVRKRLQKNLDDTADAAKNGKEAAKQYGEELNKLSESSKKAAENAKMLQDSLDDMLSEAQFNNVTSGMSEVDKGLAEVDKKVAHLTKQYGALNAEGLRQVDAIKGNTRAYLEHEKALDDAKAAAEAYQKQQEEMWAPIEHGIERVQDSFADMLYDWKFTTGSMVDIAKRAGAEMAAAFLFSQVSGGLSFSGISGASGAGASSGGGAGGMSSLLSGGSSLLSGLRSGFNSPIFGAGSTIGSGIDSVGNFFGLSGGVAQGPTLSGAGYSTGISSNFTPGAAGAGVAGGYLSSLAFGGGMGNTVGSTLGGLAGTALNVPVTAALAPFLGPVAPFVAPFLGSFLGGGLGSLFGGGKPSNKLQYGSVDLATGGLFDVGGQTGKKYDPNNAGARDAALATAAQIAASISAITGQAVSKTLKVSIGNRSGITSQFGDGEIVAAGDTKQLLANITRGIVDSLAEVPADLKAAIDKIDFSDTAKALNDIAFAAGFDKLGELPEMVSAVDAAIKELNTQFDAAAKKANELGLSEARVNEARATSLMRLGDSFSNEIGAQILELVSPGNSAIVEEQRLYQQQLKDAATLKLDTQAIELRHQLVMKKLLEQNGNKAEDLVGSFKSISDGLGSFLNDLSYGGLSNKAPIANLTELQATLMDTGNRARLGDTTAGAALPALLRDFVELNDKVYGAGALGQEGRKVAETLARETKGVADRQLSIQEQIAASSLDTIQVLKDGFASLVPSGGNPNTRLIASMATSADGTRRAGTFSEEQINALFMQAGVTVAPGEGRRTAFLDANPLIAKQVETLFHNAGVPGFKTGGSFTVGGSGGADSQYVGFMATPGEMVNVQRPGGANDNRTLDELRALRGDMHTLINLMAAVGEKTVGGQQALSSALSDLARSQRSLAANIA